MSLDKPLLTIGKVATILTVVATAVAAVLCVIYGKDAEQKVMGAICCAGVSVGFGYFVYLDWFKKK